jgi:hypothetical protein
LETSGLLPSWEKVPEGRMRGKPHPQEQRADHRPAPITFSLTR